MILKGKVVDDGQLSIVRILLFVASGLAYFNINVPESTVELISYIVFGLIGLYTAYKNNYLFKRGMAQKEVLEAVELYEENK